MKTLNHDCNQINEVENSNNFNWSRMMHFFILLIVPTFQLENVFQNFVYLLDTPVSIAEKLLFYPLAPHIHIMPYHKALTKGYVVE